MTGSSNTVDCRVNHEPLFQNEEDNIDDFLTPAGIDNSQNGMGMRIFPVPNDGRFIVSIISPASEKFTIRIFNSLGMKIQDTDRILQEGTNELSFDLRPVPAGLYTVFLENDRQQVIRKILIR